MYRNIPILYRVLESFFRYRLLFLISAAIVTLIPAAVLLTRKPMYTATGLIQIINQDTSQILGNTQGNGSWTTLAQQHIQKFNDRLSDDSPGGFVDKALQLANLHRPISVDPRARDPRLALLRKGLNLTSVSDTVFSVNLVWDNSDECEQIVKAMENEYIESVGQEKQQEAAKTVEFLDGELAKYSGQLRIAEDAVRDFKAKNKGEGETAQTQEMEQLSDLKIHLNELEVTSHNTDLKRDIITKRMALISPTSIKEQNIRETESPLQASKKQLLDEKQKLLLAGYLPTSQKVVAVDAQIKAVQDQIDEEAKHPAPTKKDVIMQPNPEYVDLQNQLNDANIAGSTEAAEIGVLQKQITEYEARIARLPELEKQLNDVTRPSNVLKTEYEDLMKRREQAVLKRNLDKVSATSQVRTIGTVYAQSTGGKAKMAMMLGGLLVFGLILGLGVTVLAEWADPTLRFATDVQRRLGVPVLISLPELAPLRMAAPSLPEGDMQGGRPLLPSRDE